MTLRRLIFGRASLIATAGFLVVCGGFTAVSPARAIKGGSEAGEPYGFLGSLQRLDSPRDDLHVCGVALVAPQWGVTAGHCARSAADSPGARPPSGHPVGWQVRFGSTTVDTGGDLVQVEQFIKKSTGIGRAADDIALLRFNRSVRQAPIAVAAERPATDTDVRIMGWGALNVECGKNYDDPSCYAKTLRQADTKVQPQETCSLERDPNILCIGSLDGTVGPEDMDSGGPAVVRDGHQWKLAGLTEGGADTGTLQAPSTYVSVARHTDWIKRYTEGRTPSPPDSPPPTPPINGTVTLAGCSGSVIRGSQAHPNDHLLILTNGHCVDPRPRPGEAFGQRPVTLTVQVIGKDGNSVLRTKTTDLLYATMTDTDLAVYRLDATYADLDRRGVEIFTLSDRNPAPGQQVQVLSGAWQKGFDCAVDSIVETLREGGYTQRDAIRYVKSGTCGPGPGTSGSPIVDSEGKIIGIHNTSAYPKNPAEDELPPEDRTTPPAACAENNPCEVGPDGKVASHEGAHYGQRLMGLNACISQGSELRLESVGCNLAKPSAAADISSNVSDRKPWRMTTMVVAILGGIALIGLGGIVMIRRSR
ncbi:trypsin-like serine protease [Nocardia transvalensis]|uniref:trypsin-like serine protease n=1 Tax=Nocardia transvalensis TaxID=37333 RepID=UPI001892EC4D|nr:trypsin-like serine protease [Nocardia transvalensis]MBF6331934.1 trypsin-like serine protease [Nocardia transvalensis]